MLHQQRQVTQGILLKYLEEAAIPGDQKKTNEDSGLVSSVQCVCFQEKRRVTNPADYHSNSTVTKSAAMRSCLIQCSETKETKLQSAIWN